MITCPSRHIPLQGVLNGASTPTSKELVRRAMVDMCLFQVIHWIIATNCSSRFQGMMHFSPGFLDGQFPWQTFFHCPEEGRILQKSYPSFLFIFRWDSGGWKLKAHVHKLAQVSRTKENMGEWEMGEVHQYFLALDDSSMLHAVQTLSCGGLTSESS